MAACAALLCVLGAGPALADDGASIERGRTAARGLLILRDPKACGIAVLRERCIADADAFLHGRGDADLKAPNLGPHPATGLRAFVANGDRDGFDFALAWYNNTFASEAEWKADPREAALHDAGIVEVMLPTAGANEAVQFMQSMAVYDMARHAQSIPPGTLPIDAAPLRTIADEANPRPNLYRMTHLVPFAKSLASAVAAKAPPPPIAPVPAADSPAADAALGVAFATMQELIDSPLWAAQNDAQAFATALADRFDALVPPAARARVVAFRAAVRTGASFDHDVANAALTAAADAFQAAAPRERAQRFAFAAVAAQLAYNSAVTRSPEASTKMLGALAGPTPLDAAIPGWADARAQGGSIGPSDWLAQHAYALRLVDLIQKADRP